MVLWKQLAWMSKLMHLKGWNGNCRFGFPFASHVEPIFFFNKETNKWEYYGPQ
jgi:hypothetical protein